LTLSIRRCENKKLKKMRKQDVGDGEDEVEEEVVVVVEEDGITIMAKETISITIIMWVKRHQHRRRPHLLVVLIKFL
jgi:hypothetical protein